MDGAKFKKGEIVCVTFLGETTEREVIDEPQFDRGEYTYDVGYSERICESDIAEASVNVSQE